MKFRASLAVLFLGGAVFVYQQAQRTPPGSNVMAVSKDDPEILAARDKARARLGEFLDAAAAPPPGSRAFSVKYPIVDGDQVEHFWLSYRGREGAVVIGEIDAEPQFVKNVRKGQVVRAPVADIEDWAYVLNGKLKGGASTCVLLARHGPEQFEALKAKLGLECA